MLQSFVLPEISKFSDEMIAIRHQIHSNPELGFEEEQTSALVADLLEKWGYSITRGIAKTGVVAQLKNGDGPSIGLRADMDALPMQEETGLPYASKAPGKMHACGHDGHTTVLLTAARYFAENRNFKGTINLFFQPAEEGGGGAKVMVDEGLLTKFPCNAIFAFHNMPGFPVGHCGFVPGAAMASSDIVTITVKGRGGHGAMPQLSIDPVVVASSIVMALQTIVSRNINPLDMTIITVGCITAGTTDNIIPDEANMKLTIRNLDPKTQDLVEKRVKEIVEHQAKSYGATTTVDYHRNYPILINSETETDFAHKVAQDVLGQDKIIENFPRITASEDFSYMLQNCPGCYIFVGNGLEGTHGCSVHNPGYDFNDELIGIVSSFWAKLVENYLKA